MGLLDFMGSDFEDPKTMATLQLAAGLLGGKGSGMQRLSQGLLGYGATMGAAKKAKQDEDRLALEGELRKAQIAETLAQAKEREAAVAKQQQLAGLISGVFARPETQSPVSGGASDQPAAQRVGLQGLTLDQIAQLKAMGGPDLLEAWKVGQTGLENKPGSFYTLNGKQTYTPDPTKGIGFNGAQVFALPGSIETEAARTGAVETAKALAQAGTEFVSVVGDDGATRIIPKSQALAMTKPGIGVSQMRVDLSDPLTQFSSPAVRDAVQRAAGMPNAGPGLKTGLGPAEKWTPNLQQGVAVNELGQTKPLTDEGGKPFGSEGARKDLKGNNEFLAAAKQARSLLESNPTGSGVGAAIDAGAALLGVTPKGAKQAQALEAVSGWLVKNVPRMEGPQSNYDVENYKAMAGKVGDRRLPVEVRVAALDVVESLIKKYSELSGGDSSSSEPSTSPKVRRYNPQTGRIE